MYIISTIQFYFVFIVLNYIIVKILLLLINIIIIIIDAVPSAVKNNDNKISQAFCISIA